MRWVTNNKEVIRIDASGNIGIGCSSPSAAGLLPKEPLTEWYKNSVKQIGATPHVKVKDGNSKT
jgi:hypothetical protein